MKNTLGQFDEKAYSLFIEMSAEVYSFGTCQRADGSYYGSPGRCVKGSDATLPKKEKAAKKAKTQKEKTSNSGGDTAPKKEPKVKEEKAKLTAKEKKAMAAGSADYLNRKAEDKDGILKYDGADKPPESKISNAAKKSILAYTESQQEAPTNDQGHLGMNGCSRNPPSCNDRQKKENEAMDKALQELPRNVKQSITGEVEAGSYFRGIDVTDNPALGNALVRVKPGETLTDPGFGSYSRNLEAAKGFNSPAGDPTRRNVVIVSRSAEIRNVERYSDYESEQEGILPRGTQQTVRSTETIGNTTYINVY